MINLGFSMAQLEAFLLIFIRMSGLFILSPIFGRRNLPAIFKIGFSFFLAIIFVNTTEIPVINMTENIALYVLYIVKELIVGLVIGYATYVIMSAIYLAGQMIDMQVGFGSVNVLDATSNIQVPLTSNFYYMYIILIFLTLNGHFFIIRALFKSFELVPIDMLGFNINFVTEVIDIMQVMFEIAIRIAAPIIATIFVADVVLGILSRTIPQMNVFQLGMPLKVIIGLAVIMVTFIYANGITEVVADLMNEYMLRFLTTMGT
ncbi:MAG: flagellar type III secretion system protein FliR [Clostridiales bacterium]|nr:flagellar type III secretion system protein FliR [Clostridiales bacterium]